MPSHTMSSSTTRILFLGDSFTWGHGVKNGSDRFTDLLEVELNSQPSGNVFHIYNAGKNGTFPHDWLQYLNVLLPIYKPHFVVIVFFLRDGTPLCTSLNCYKKELATLRAPYESFGYRQSATIRAISDRAISGDFWRLYESKIMSSYLGTAEERAQWAKEQGAIREIVETCRASHVRVEFVIFPILIGLDAIGFMILCWGSFLNCRNLQQNWTTIYCSTMSPAPTSKG